VIKHFSLKKACAILGCALVLQIVDTGNGYLPMRARHQQPQDLRFGQPNQSDFWQKAAARYTNVRIFPLHINPLPQSAWYTLATYAAKYHLATNAVYLSRLDKQKVDAANRQFRDQLRLNNLDPQTLYVFEDADVAYVRPFVNRQKDYLAKIDNSLVVLAPNWKVCSDCPLDTYEKAVDALMIKSALGQRFIFTNSNFSDKIIGWGWAKPESWGVWADESIAVISLVLPERARSVSIEFNALVSKKHPQQRVKLRINNNHEQLVTFTQARNNVINLTLPPDIRGPYVQFEFEFLDRIRPKDLGMNEDVRPLSCGLLAITFH
jgi:hypothetical protein